MAGGSVLACFLPVPPMSPQGSDTGLLLIRHFFKKDSDLLKAAK